MGLLYIAVVGGGLLMIRSVDVAPGLGSAALARGALQAAVGLLLVAFVLIGRRVRGLLAAAACLLAGTYFLHAWSAVRAEAPAVESAAAAMFAAALIALLVHATREESPPAPK